MGYVPGFKHDVFVSYAHVDDNKSMYPAGWVAELVSRLKGACYQWLGEKNIAITRDSDLKLNDQIDSLIEAAENSALFLAIGSPAYVEREWTRRELEAFSRTGAGSERCFVAECLPLWENQCYPQPIDRQHRIRFHDARRPISFGGARGDEFNQLAMDLAGQISRQLRVMRSERCPGSGRAEKPTARPKAESPKGNVVLLAETTDDLTRQHNEVRRYLTQFEDIEVLPAAGYPQGGAAFEAAFAADAARAKLFVQLLGEFPGRQPPDLSTTYVRRQAQIAAEHQLEILQWRPPDLDIETVEDEEHRRMLGGETVIRSGLKEFQRIVKDHALKPEPKPRDGAGSLAFVAADQKDIEFAQRVRDEFESSSISVSLPLFLPKAEENREDLEGNLLESEAILFVYGSASPVHVRALLRSWDRVKWRREQNPRMLALCLGPPPDKPDLAMTVPGLRQVDCRGSDLACLKALVSELMR